MPSYTDQVFILSEATGPTFVLKIADSDADTAFLAGQARVLEHLRRSPSTDPGARLPIPEARPLADGSFFVSVPSASGTGPDAEHLMWLVSYLPGRLMAELPHYAPDLLRQLGRGLGDLDLRLAAFDDRSMRRELEWDLARASSVRPRAELIQDRTGRDRVVSRLSRFEEYVLPVLADLPRQIIHGDANDHNILVRDTAHRPGGQEVCGLLDFGDLVWTARACEPAIAMTYAMLGAESPVAAGSAVLSGYHETCPLQEDEIRLLRDLIEARLCVSVTMSAYGKQQDPDNAYLFVSEATAWRLLDRLEALSSSHVTDTFLGACDSAAGQPRGE